MSNHEIDKRIVKTKILDFLRKERVATKEKIFSAVSHHPLAEECLRELIEHKKVDEIESLTMKKIIYVLGKDQSLFSVEA